MVNAPVRSAALLDGGGTLPTLRDLRKLMGFALSSALATSTRTELLFQRAVRAQVIDGARQML